MKQKLFTGKVNAYSLRDAGVTASYLSSPGILEKEY